MTDLERRRKSNAIKSVRPNDIFGGEKDRKHLGLKGPYKTKGQELHKGRSDNQEKAEKLGHWGAKNGGLCHQNFKEENSPSQVGIQTNRRGGGDFRYYAGYLKEGGVSVSRFVPARGG